MGDRSGIGAQLGVKEEVTYGTYVAVDRFLEFNDEALALDIARDTSKGLRSGQRVGRVDHWKAGKRQAAGDVELDVPSKGFGLLLKHMTGAIATAASGTGKKHTATVGDLFGKSLTIQIGRPDVSGVVQPFSYLGCKVAKWKLENAVDDFLVATLSLDAQDETTAQALVAATAPAATEFLHWEGCVVSVAGSSMDVESVEFEGDNSLKDDRFYLRGSSLKKEPVEKVRRMLTGKLLGDLDGLTAYNRFVNGTVVQIIATWTGDLEYDTGLPNKLVVTCPACRFDGSTPKNSEETLDQELPFEILDNGSAQPISIDYFSADALP